MKTLAGFTTVAAELDGRWAAIAYYNRAFCTIRNKANGYQVNAKRDLKETLKSLEHYKSELTLTRTLAALFLACDRGRRGLL